METAVVSQLIDQYGMDVMRFCRSLTRCACDAEDLYQQTFLKLLQLRVKVEREQNPRAFLFSIWKNECRKWGRRAAIAPSSSLEELQEQPPLEPPDGGDLQQQVLDRMCQQELARAVQRLEEKYRSPVILMYRFGMGIDEIARIERVPKGTIKQAQPGQKTASQRNGGTRLCTGILERNHLICCCARPCSRKQQKNSRRSSAP